MPRPAAHIREAVPADATELLDLYGSPYPDDIGPGKTYAQDYSGPDFLHPFYVETPEHDRLWFEQRPPRDFDFDQ